MSVQTGPRHLHPTEIIELTERFDQARWATEALVEPLSADDCSIASHSCARSAKWHLGHTTWSIERNVLHGRMPNYEIFDAAFDDVFPSTSRPDRGGLGGGGAEEVGLPSLDEVFDYRSCVDRSVILFVHADRSRRLARCLESAIQHELRHQEGLLTDVKHLLAGRSGGLLQAEEEADEEATSLVSGWIGFEFREGAGGDRRSDRAFALAEGLVTNGQWREFVADGGYRREELWREQGWRRLREQKWEAPLYWYRANGHWWHNTLAGPMPLEDAEPVCHVSFYEAEAFARWTGDRLPSDFEWRRAAADVPIEGNFLDRGRLRPSIAGARAGRNSGGVRQLFGDVWEWTSSPAEPDDHGEGRAMIVRGGSCVTPLDRIRNDSRRVLDPAARCHFTGVRLARDVSS